MTDAELKQLTTIAQVDAEIAKRQALLRDCVGWLYPSILVDELTKLRERRRGLLTPQVDYHQPSRRRTRSDTE